jgi:hypothetical protein
MNNDKEKKNNNIGTMGASKLDVAPVGDCSGIFDDTTDRLLQDAIRNIDQLTSVARKLSSENIHSLLIPDENTLPVESSKRMDSSTPAMIQPDRSTSSAASSSSQAAMCRFVIVL